MKTVRRGGSRRQACHYSMVMLESGRGSGEAAMELTTLCITRQLRLFQQVSGGRIVGGGGAPNEVPCCFSRHSAQTHDTQVIEQWRRGQRHTGQYRRNGRRHRFRGKF